MKQILTLLIAFGMVAAAHAQTSRDEARRVILGQPKSGNYPSDSRDVILGGNNPNYPSNYPNGSSVDQINRDYNYRIQQVRNDRSISRAEKERQIRALERERQIRIRNLNNQNNGNYGRNNNGNYGRNNNGNYDRDNEDRHDNGKHKGWEKGVGNPHRNGGNPGHGNGKNKGNRDDD